MTAGRTKSVKPTCPGLLKKKGEARYFLPKGTLGKRSFTRPSMMCSSETSNGAVSQLSTLVMEMRRSKFRGWMLYVYVWCLVSVFSPDYACQTLNMKPKQIFVHTVNMTHRLVSIISKTLSWCLVIGHEIKTCVVHAEWWCVHANHLRNYRISLQMTQTPITRVHHSCLSFLAVKRWHCQLPWDSTTTTQSIYLLATFGTLCGER